MSNLYSNKIIEREKRHKANLTTSILPTTNTILYMGPSIHNCDSTLRKRSGKKDCEVSMVRGKE